MTTKEYYDLLVKTSEDGLFPSVDKNGYCMYRSPEGRRCAIGIILPDEQYQRTFDIHNWPVATLLTECGDKSWVPEGITLMDLVSIQCAHDSCTADFSLQPQLWNHEDFLKKLNSVGCFKEIGGSKLPPK